jgi:hypothetical protein
VELTEGVLVLADISGYTEFVAQTEIDHSWEILRELLDTMVRSVRGSLEVSQVEGDCILFIGGIDETRAIELLERSYVAYHRRLRAMQAGTTCPCAACRTLGGLRIKFVLNRGTYSRQKVGNVEQLHGSDVIVGFRLLKNSIPSHEYILATTPVLDRLPPAVAATFTPHSETYDHLGTVPGGYVELAPLWAAAQAAERKRVDPAEAKVSGSVVVEGDPAAVWPVAEEPELWRRLMEVADVEKVAGARGGMADAEYHCHHGKDGKELIVFRIISAVPERESHMVSSVAGLDLYQSFYAEPAGPGRTRVSVHYDWKQGPGVDGAIREVVMRFVMRQSVGRFRKNLPVLARELTSRAASAVPA